MMHRVTLVITISFVVIINIKMATNTYIYLRRLR